MGNKAKVFHGARAKVYIKSKLVGIFQSASWGYDLSIEPAYILGRFSAADLGYTAADVVRMECSGWRVIDGGPHQQLDSTSKLVPTLEELLDHEDMTFEVVDRQSGKSVVKVVGVRCAGYRSGVSARQLSEMSLPFVGLRIEDESLAATGNEENGTATPSL